MAQTGYTPIQIYSTSTAAAVPTAGSLTNSTLGSELAINITDGKLFYKDNANTVQVIGWKVVPTTAGGTGLTSYAQGDLLYYNSGTTLTALAKNTTATRYLSNTGTNNNPAWAQIDLTNGVTGTLPTGNGGTGLTSFTANGVVYASSTSALATGSTLTFDGTNLALGTTFTNPTRLTIGTNSTSLVATNFLSIQNRGTNTTDNTNTYVVGGVLFSGYRDVRNPSNIAGIWAERSPASSGLSSNGALIFGTITGGGGGNITQDGSGGLPTEAARITPAGNLQLANGNLVISTSGKGIDFSATPGTGTSELLNDYEQGTFNPTIIGSTTAGTATYSIQIGRYTKIGNRVLVSIYLAYSGGNGTGNLRITGLPFTSESTANNISNLATYVSDIALTANNFATSYVIVNSTSIALDQTPVGGGTASNVAYDGAGAMLLSGHYQTADL